MTCALHAPIPPSLAPQWGNCSAALVAKMTSPERTNQRTVEGTAAHWVGGECLLAWQRPDDGAPSCSTWIGDVAPNGIVIDREMSDGAQVYVDDVLDMAQRHGALSRLLIEHRVDMPRIHADNWGTLDAALPLFEKNLLFIWDYKHGHRTTHARGNLQLIDYIEGLVEQYNINGAQDQDITVVMRIVQPYCYRAGGAVDEWVVKLSDLRVYFNQLHKMAHEATTNPKMSPGSWCRDCPALGSCSAARLAGYGLIDYVNEPYVIDQMSDADLAVEYAILEAGQVTIKARLSAVGDEIKHRVGNGATDTGYALQATTKNLAWTVPNEQARFFAQQFGVDIAKNEVLTPTQAKAECAPELRADFETALKEITKRPFSGHKLIDAEGHISALAFKRSK